MFHAKKQILIKVNTFDAELDLAMYNTSTGKQVFERVVSTVGLREVWYFGLRYIDSNFMVSWINFDKAIKDQDLPKENIKLELRVKFYPEDISEELIQDITVKMFYYEVKQCILRDTIYSPPETAVLLACCALQADFGDYTEESFDTIVYELEKNRILPQRVRDQHGYSSVEWANKIIPWYKEQAGKFTEDAHREYLTIAQDLDMFGLTYFDITNKKGTKLYLGVSSLGINIYERDKKVTPKIGIQWSEIRHLSFSFRSFKIHPKDERGEDFVLRVEKPKMNKLILSICTGNHELYLRRRKPDTIEMQQMRVQAKQKRKKQVEEREKLEQEQRTRQEFEKKNKELEKKLQDIERVAREREEQLRMMKEENEALRVDLNQVQDDINKMENEKSELGQQMEDLRNRVEQGEMDKEQFTTEMQQKEQEFQKIQEDLKTKIDEAEKINQTLTKEIDNQSYLMSQMNVDKKEDDEAGGIALDQENVEGIDNELDRETAKEKDAKLGNKLDQLSKDLESTRKTNVNTPEDDQYNEAVKLGNNKYKTLNNIRKGNTKLRVTEFECL